MIRRPKLSTNLAGRFGPQLKAHSTHTFMGRSFITIWLCLLDDQVRVYLEHENIPAYFRSKSQFHRLSRFTLDLPRLADETVVTGPLYAMQIKSKKLTLLIDPKTRSFYQLLDPEQLPARAIKVDREETKKLCLPER